MTSLADIDRALSIAVERRDLERAAGNDVAVCVQVQRIEELLAKRSELKRNGANA